MAETAKKKHPEKWERAKRKARKKMGGHSARAMQLATKYYKEMGGKYEGKKSSKNKLSKWSKEDWQTREEYEKKKMNIRKQQQKLLKVSCKAQECVSREEAQKLLRKARKISKKLHNSGRQSTRERED